MKKLLLLFAFATGLFAQTMSVNLPASMQPGVQYNGTISLNCPTCAAVQWSLSLFTGATIFGSSSSVVFSETAGSSATAASKTASCSTTPGMFNCVVASSSNMNVIPNGPIMLFSVSVSPGTTPGNVTLNVTNIVATDATGKAVTIAAVSPITVAIVSTPCDINGDGKTDVNDYNLVLAQVLQINACTTGDINKNGVCNVIDLMDITQAIITGVCTVN